MWKLEPVIRYRAFRVVAAALAASVVALIAVAALSFLLFAGLMFFRLPQAEWAGFLLGGLLIVVFGLTFVVSFRDVLDKVTPQ